MEQRRLGTTDLVVSRLVLGCGGFGGIGSEHSLIGEGESYEESAAIMDAAWDHGITTFDTADAYGGGLSESAIGRWTKARRRRPIITTKTFHPMSPGDDKGLAPARIRRQLESSLNRIGVDCIDLYLTHEPDDSTPLDETLGVLDELVTAGKIRAYGGSHITHDLLLKASGRYRCIQNSYSLLDPRDASDVLPAVEETDLGYEAYSPLSGGWLTGKYRRSAKPPRGSRMALRPDPYRALDHEDVWSALQDFDNWAGARGMTMTQAAYNWVLSDSRVTAVLIGPRTPDHVTAAVEAAEQPRFSEPERDELTGLFDPVGARTGIPAPETEKPCCQGFSSSGGRI
ncbi:MAG TPA: aldo/keto reductase [Gaiellaceae bacterium]|nr:aldo/keto reductase [Gaiellaceae bacterium]